MSKKIKIGALISGGGSNLQAVIDACESEKIDAEIVFVGSDTPEVHGLNRAKKHNIPSFTVDYKTIIRSYKENPTKIEVPEDFDLEKIMTSQTLFPPETPYEQLKTFLMTRAVAETKLLEYMRLYDFDLLILAGFMRTLTPYFIDHVNTHGDLRIMNIHPALLPAFPGVDGYGDTFRYGCKVGGCTVHFIDYGEDTGPIVGQRAFPIEANDTLETVKKKGLQLEWELYPHCIQMFAEKKLNP